MLPHSSAAVGVFWLLLYPLYDAYNVWGSGWRPLHGVHHLFVGIETRKSSAGMEAAGVAG